MTTFAFRLKLNQSLILNRNPFEIQSKLEWALSNHESPRTAMKRERFSYLQNQRLVNLHANMLGCLWSQIGKSRCQHCNCKFPSWQVPSMLCACNHISSLEVSSHANFSVSIKFTATPKAAYVFSRGTRGGFVKFFKSENQWNFSCCLMKFSSFSRLVILQSRKGIGKGSAFTCACLTILSVSKPISK